MGAVPPCPRRAPGTGRRLGLLLGLVLSLLALWALPRGERSTLVLNLRAEVAPAADAGAAAPLPSIVLRQFAAVTPTADFRHDLVKAMRAWRRGIPTLVLTNATGAELAAEQAEGRRYNERWVHFPNHPDFSVTSRWCSRAPLACDKSGDPRAAMAPLLARAHLGDAFKWLVYGDDDIAFFWPGLLRLVQGLSPEDPYMLTDNLYSRWAGGPKPLKAPVPQALDQPRCVPCTLDDEGLDLQASHALKTCNCTVASLAAAFADLVPGQKPWKDFPSKPPILTISGAAGAVLSIGLLRRLNVSLYESCMWGREEATGGPTFAGGGDGLFTRCLWHQGFGYTDPAFELRHRGNQLGHPLLLFNGYDNDWPRMNRDVADALVGACTGDCRLWLDHMVSLHTHGRSMSSYREASVAIRRFLHSAAVYAAAFAPMETLAAGLLQ